MDKSNLVQEYLVNSYLYYELSQSVLTDFEFDTLCKNLLENWDTVHHPHKHRINPETLKGGSGYDLHGRYPKSIKMEARKRLPQDDK